MSGFGERFRRAGYTVPKPLIEVEGKPIIAHVVDLFPEETDILFICNEDHLNTPEFQMRETLERICPTGRVIGIAPHKLGPIHAVQQIQHLLDPNEPVVINYCDFTCYWDWDHFKSFVLKTKCQGAVPAYKGFHPHTLGTTNYAYMRESDGWMQDIQEKQPFTTNRMEEYASSGTYYFATAHLMMAMFEATVEQNLQVGGEHYVSLAYKPMLAAGHSTAVYPLQHFMQWGTPEDVREYEMWSDTFRRLMVAPPEGDTAGGSVVLPMAGLGSRFAQAGYELTKPLIPVSGQPMVIQATHDLPLARQQSFVLRNDMPGQRAVGDLLKKTFPKAVIEKVDQVTEGQACSAELGVNSLAGSTSKPIGPITIGACDNGALYDRSKFRAMVADPETDVVVWGVRGYPNALRNPNMYGWVDEEGGRISNVSVKTPLSDPATDPIAIGTFTFRDNDIFDHAYERLIGREGRINGEFYLDSLVNDCIALGFNCRLFEVDSFLCWGTPDDLRTFEYWQSCFHKWSGHPYRLEEDPRIPDDQIPDLEERYQTIVPQLPSRALM